VYITRHTPQWLHLVAICVKQFEPEVWCTQINTPFAAIVIAAPNLTILIFIYLGLAHYQAKRNSLLPQVALLDESCAIPLVDLVLFQRKYLIPECVGGPDRPCACIVTVVATLAPTNHGSSMLSNTATISKFLSINS
jgi:hypothetical protein